MLAATWPTLDEYRRGLQNPAHCFSVPLLREGAVELTSLGLPRLVCGRFAAVCRFECGGATHALRLFQQPQPERRERYQAIDTYLRQRRCRPFVGFDYYDDGFCWTGESYPLVLMEWVAGVPLNVYAAECAQRRDRQTLMYLSRRWMETVHSLAAHGIAHGDLQHGNVLVEGRRFRLVDYDGMYVPSLDGRASLELGLADYQHPMRSAADFDARLDFFAACAIFVALRALAADLEGAW